MRINRRKAPPATVSPVPSFFKIIFPSNLITHNLRIPKDFAKLYRTEWSSSVKLIVPNGETWDVGLHKDGKSIWFSDGWKEFSEHYSIGCWFLLTFDYVGPSMFNVHIYNITCTEITYPRNKRNLTSTSVKQTQCSSKKSVPYERFNPETREKRRYFTISKRRKLEDEGRKIKFESMKVSRKRKVGACEIPGQNKCEDEMRDLESLFIPEANDGRPHQLKFSGQMELATQNEDDEQETVKGETEVDSAISPWEDKSRNKGVIFSSENPALTVILEPYYAKYLFGNLSAHIIFEAKYQSCWTVYLPLKFSINYRNFTSKALVPLASSVNQWEVIPARDQHQINIRQFDVSECDFESTEYPAASLLDISESEGNKSVELSELAPEFSQGIKKYATKRLKSDNSYFTRSKRQRLDDKRKASAEGMVRVYEMPSSRRSSLIDTPDHKERKQDKNLVNSQSAKDGPNPTEDAHHMDSVARNEGYEQQTIRNEVMESPIPKMMTRKSSKALGRNKTISQVMMTENPAYTVIMKPRQVRYCFLMYKPLEFSINYLHFTSKAMVPLAPCGNQREVVLEKHKPQANIQQFKVPECRCDHSVAQKLSELAPEFSQRINTYAEHFCSTKRLRSDNHYFTRSKRHRLDDDRKATTVGNVRVHDMHNSRRTSIIDIPDQNKSKQPKNLENSHSGKDGSNPTEGSHRMDSEAQNEGYEQLTIRNEDVELSVPKMMTRDMAISKVMMFKTENPTFTVIMKPNHVRHCFSVYIPVGFSRKHLGIITSRTRIHLTYGGKKWEVIVVINAKNYYLSGGWVTFVKDNGLMVGDVCVFEMVEVRNVVLKVSIFRTNEGGQKTSPQK